MSESDYEILGIDRNATQDEINRAFRRMARKYHPDLNLGNAEAAKQFKICKNAYDNLRDQKTREQSWQGWDFDWQPEQKEKPKPKQKRKQKERKRVCTPDKEKQQRVEKRTRKREKEQSQVKLQAVVHAATKGNAEAQHCLGWRYEEGKGVPEDKAEAVKWYRLAAEQGYDEAQNSLGRCYIFGEGVPQDKATGIKWLRKAAKAGNEEAKELLQEMSWTISTGGWPNLIYCLTIACVVVAALILYWLL